MKKTSITGSVKKGAKAPMTRPVKQGPLKSFQGTTPKPGKRK